MEGLKDKVVVVAGAASGLGAASARRLAADGAKVVVGDLNEVGAENTAAGIRESGGDATAVGFDISDDDSVRGLIEAAVAAYGGVDSAHVNAGDMRAVRSDTNVVDIDLGLWDQTMAVNLRGHMLVSRHAVPRIAARGGGAVVYTSSVLSFSDDPEWRGRVAYSVAKAGINALARHVASRWGKEGVRANAIAPGLILHENVGPGSSSAYLDSMLARTRSTRHGQARDIASMVAFLCSEEGSWINGQTIPVDGGFNLR